MNVKMKRIFSILLWITLILALGINFSGCTKNESNNSSATFNYEYTNRHGEKLSFTYEYEQTIYEVLPNQLIEEWHDNVAAAEKKYRQDDVAIITEGIIDSINKDRDEDSYYIELRDENSSDDLFGIDNIRVDFLSDREYEELLNYKQGDYIVL